jgi:alkanesulfonate monooxygenase SsuD/methylene tetrahydromethanopterin reductase-like flavin-dependent oxidoreductase (luciferase family)
MEQAGVEHALRYAVIGSPETVRSKLEAFIALTNPDELMVTAQIFDHTARLRSFEILAELRESIRSTSVRVGS